MKTFSLLYRATCNAFYYFKPQRHKEHKEIIII